MLVELLLAPARSFVVIKVVGCMGLSRDRGWEATDPDGDSRSQLAGELGDSRMRRLRVVTLPPHSLCFLVRRFFA